MGHEDEANGLRQANSSIAHQQQYTKAGVRECQILHSLELTGKVVEDIGDIMEWRCGGHEDSMESVYYHPATDHQVHANTLYISNILAQMSTA